MAVRFEKDAQLQDVVTVSTGISPDGNEASLLFTNLEVRTQGRGGPSVATRTVSLSLPIAENDTDRTVSQHIRGHVSSTYGARLVLLAQLSGKTFLVDLPPDKEDVFFQQFESMVPVGKSYQATFFLLAECDSDLAEGLLVVDSLDVFFP